MVAGSLICIVFCCCIRVSRLNETGIRHFLLEFTVLKSPPKYYENPRMGMFF